MVHFIVPVITTIVLFAIMLYNTTLTVKYVANGTGKKKMLITLTASVVLLVAAILLIINQL